MLNLHKLLPENRDKLQLYYSITKLKQSKDFQLLLEFLSGAHEQIDKENRKAQPPLVQWNQGASQFLQELNELISNSELHSKKLAETANP